MKNPFSKVPFLFLLIPLLLGILLQYYLNLDIKWSISISSLGIILMLFSYISPSRLAYKGRWLFGVGVFACMITVGDMSTKYRQSQMTFDFDIQSKYYRGVIEYLPQTKPKSIAYQVYLPNEDRTIICYFSQSDSVASQLLPGDEFLFYSTIQPFDYLGTFDYARYMYDQGIIGSSYIKSDHMLITGKSEKTFRSEALRYRQKILSFYKSLEFDNDQLAILSALTLGDRRELTADLNESFRITGTVHILSVSGLHVGIIYVIISSLLFFVRRSSQYYFIKPLIIIALLWIYSFLTGLPPSVIRASTMLTIFCIAEIFNRTNYSPLNTLSIAAFFMLLINPFSFFDIGFQLSFISVLSILYLYPMIYRSIKIRIRFLRYIWQISALSSAAQLASFPLCLYYFGSFPTYFLIANIVIVPLVSLIMYSFCILIVAGCIGFIFPIPVSILYYLPVELLKLLVDIMVKAAQMIENLPYANVNSVNISFIELWIIYFFILSVIFYLNKKSKMLIISLFIILLLINTSIFQTLFYENNSFTKDSLFDKYVMQYNI